MPDLVSDAAAMAPLILLSLPRVPARVRSSCPVWPRLMDPAFRSEALILRFAGVVTPAPRLMPPVTTTEPFEMSALFPPSLTLPSIRMDAALPDGAVAPVSIVPASLTMPEPLRLLSDCSATDSPDCAVMLTPLAITTSPLALSDNFVRGPAVLLLNALIVTLPSTAVDVPVVVVPPAVAVPPVIAVPLVFPDVGVCARSVTLAPLSSHD